MKHVISLVEDSIPGWAPTPGAGDQHLAVGASPAQFSALDERTRFCVINVQTADVRMTLDGGSPVGGSVGALLPAGTFIYWGRNAVERMKFVQDGGLAAVLWLQEFVTAAKP